MFDFNKKQMNRPISQPKEGCQIKVKYDQHGRVKELQDNGLCSKQDREAFLNNLRIGKTTDDFEED